jgi:type II secretory ATPase GspE/PulE/Tfp pilus assembly ATPase PilB-like protein
MWDKGERIGKMLVNMGLVDEDQVKAALKQSSDNGKSLGQNMFELGFVTDSSLLQLLVAQGAATPWFLNSTPPEGRVLRILSPSVMREHMLMPIVRLGDLLLLAMADPDDHAALDRVRALTGLRIESVAAEPERIKEVIETILNDERAKQPSPNIVTVAEPPPPLEDLAAPIVDEAPAQEQVAPEAVTQIQFEASSLGEKKKKSEPKAPAAAPAPATPQARERLTVDHDVVTADDTAPVAGLVDQIIADSVRRNASEILIESTTDGMAVRYRVDGRLRSIGDIPKSLAPLVEARLRLMASLDIWGSNTPQSAVLHYEMSSRTVEFEACIIPTVHGTRFLLRARNGCAEAKKLEDIGLAKNELGLVRNAIESNEGLILVVAPSSAERSWPIYSLIAELASPARDILTCEEVPGVSVSGVSHSKFVHRHERSRAEHLSMLFRQSSDVVIVDNLSDERSASMSVRGALSGRLVVAGLEAKSALAAVARIIDLGVDPYLAAASLCGVLAQRQVRTLCPSCKKKDGSGFKSAGCGECEGTGYKGTTDVYEFLPINDEVRKLIAEKAPLNKIEDAAKKAGFQAMAVHAKTKLDRGETDARELDSTFRRPVADDKSESKGFDLPVIEPSAKSEVAVPVAASRAKIGETEDIESLAYRAEIERERKELDAYFTQQSYDGSQEAA